METRQESFGDFTRYLVDERVVMTIKAPHGILILWHPKGKVTLQHGEAIKRFMAWQRGMEE